MRVLVLFRRLLLVVTVALCSSFIKSLPFVVQLCVDKISHSLAIRSLTQTGSEPKSHSDNDEAWSILDSILSDGKQPLTSIDYVLTSLRVDLPKPQGDIQGLGRKTYYLIEPKLNPLEFDHNTLLVFVQSGPERFAERERIRETWGSLQNYRKSRHIVPIQVIFVLGLPPDIYSPGYSSSMDGVLLENSLAHDILLLNMLDTYNSLAYKGLLAMLWAVNRSPRINYIFKTDDDVLINTFAWINLINVMERYSIACTVVGNVWTKPEVLRRGKYKEMLTEYEYDLYPSFCSGAGYLMSRATMTTVLEASFHLPIMKRDDPFYTGIIPRQTNIRLLSIPLSSYGISVGTNRNLTFFAHSPSSEDWHTSWRDFQRHHNRGIRLPVTISDETDRATSLPKAWSLSKDVTLRRQCTPRRSFKAFIVRL